MTNREWLTSLSDRELAEYIINCNDVFRVIKNHYAYPINGITIWLNEEKGSTNSVFNPKKSLKECKKIPDLLCAVNEPCEDCTYVKEHKGELKNDS